MKYILLVGDGMADHPHPELNQQTPLQAAKTPNMDYLAANGMFGLAHTLVEGYPFGSDVANLTVMGYDPRQYYAGRAPLEAANIGVELGPRDVAFRCNLVNIQNNRMHDFSAGHIPSDDAKPLIKMLGQKLGNDRIQFYPGTSYRHLLVWKGGPLKARCVPPHDISGEEIASHLPQGPGHKDLIHLMEDSRLLLEGHEVNRERRHAGLPAANMIWLWGQGMKPVMPTITDKFHLTGSVISAVDLIKGIGLYAGLTVEKVPGVTGYLDTNYIGKAEAALKVLKKNDFVFVHVEAPDECGHNGDVAGKVRAIEDFDDKVVGIIRSGLAGRDDYKIMIMPDHATPLDVRTHTNEPVPFLIYQPGGPASGAAGFNEASARASGLEVAEGWRLMDFFITGQWPAAAGAREGMGQAAAEPEDADTASAEGGGQGL
ncbi:cofactor-independent phosphoglycerate mutase [candidate division FCPU426 bacterium]|nr:cofactor-independent phosphoglycerate mutase [candidate division FCPU426 bacterium]